MNCLEIPNGGFVSSIFHCIFNTNLVMASVNDDIKMFLTYLKTVYVKMENLLGPFSLGNGPFYLKTSWKVQSARTLRTVRHEKTLTINLPGYQHCFPMKTQTETELIKHLTFSIVKDADKNSSFVPKLSQMAALLQCDLISFKGVEPCHEVLMGF